MNEHPPTRWRCHVCRTPTQNPQFGSSGIPGVHWPFCPTCWAKLAPHEQTAVDEERKKPPAF